MSDKRLACSVTDMSNVQSISISESHSSATSTAIVQAVDCDLNVGDDINIYMGYSDNMPLMFKGYVKRVEKSSPDGVYTVNANDVLVRAVDFFIVGKGPDDPVTYKNISAENLVENVLKLAGLNDFSAPYNSYFTFGINNDVEINLVSSYDFSRQISDIIAWELWADNTGTVYFMNRKPYPMDGNSQQPGDFADEDVASIISDSVLVQATKSWNERDLRNKIVVFGDNISAKASSSVSYDPDTGGFLEILPNGFYKTTVLSSPFIDSQSFAQKAADYNLEMLNRLSYEIPVSIEGDPTLHARHTITVTSTAGDISGSWYMYQVEHNWNSGGYVTNIQLRK